MIGDVNDELGVRQTVRNTSLLFSATWLVVGGLLCGFVITKTYQYLFRPKPLGDIILPPSKPLTEQDIVRLDAEIAAVESALDIKAADMKTRIISRRSDREEFDQLNREMLRLRILRAEVASVVSGN